MPNCSIPQRDQRALTASTLTPFAILGLIATLAVGGGTGSKGKLKVKEKLSGPKKIDKLKAKLGQSDAAAFDARSFLNVQETIRIKGDYFRAGSGSSIDQSFTVVPEPTTGLMLAAGLAGLAARRRLSR
jgi:hypothetical protein